MRIIAIALALTTGSTVALAQAGGAAGASGSAGVTASPDNPHASQYWQEKAAKDGYMTREQALAYRDKDGKAYMDKSGKPMDFASVDKNGDGRISQSEWAGYHGGAVGMGKSDGSAPAGSTSGTGTK